MIFPDYPEHLPDLPPEPERRSEDDQPKNADHEPEQRIEPPFALHHEWEQVARPDKPELDEVPKALKTEIGDVDQLPNLLPPEQRLKESEVTPEMRQQWRWLMRQTPVSVNNYYGDPMVQWPDTQKKFEQLIASGHEGPVGMITKGVITPERAAKLAEYRKQGLNIICLVSISELPKEIEPLGDEHRYENIRLLNEHEVPNIAYIRPLMPPYNTSDEVIDRIYEQLDKAGGKVIVVSGFRGDETMVEEMSPDEHVEWTLRVKVITKDVYNKLKQGAEERGIQLFTRTACAVSYLAGQDRAYNPYYNSPNLVKCNELNCPLADTCAPLEKPREGSLELLKHLGYDAEFVPGRGGRRCNISGEDRLKCPSCCTTCYFSTNIPHIQVKNEVNLGDLSFIRFITGVLAMQPNRNDDGSKDIAKVRLPNYPEVENVQALNSWLPIARNIQKCFNCRYCIVDNYYNESGKNQEIGMPPANLIDQI